MDHVTTADDAERSKPEPDIFAAALQRITAAGAAQAVVVGDTPYHAEAAGKLGLTTVGLLCGGFAPEDLRACRAVYTDPSDLLTHYEASPLCRA